MKWLLSLSVIWLLAFTMSAQTNAGIQYVNIVPESPTEQDSIQVLVNLLFPTLHYLYTVEDTIVHDTVYLDLHYCGGLQLAIDVREDTFNLGPLPAGDYQLMCRVLTYDWAVTEDLPLPIMDSCIFTGIYQDSLAFRIDLLNTALQPIAPSLKVGPNPATSYLSVESEVSIRQLQLWSSSGKMVHHWPGMDSGRREIPLPDLPPGLYYLQLCFSDRPVHWECLVIMGE